MTALAPAVVDAHQNKWERQHLGDHRAGVRLLLAPPNDDSLPLTVDRRDRDSIAARTAQSQKDPRHDRLREIDGWHRFIRRVFQPERFPVGSRTNHYLALFLDAALLAGSNRRERHRLEPRPSSHDDDGKKQFRHRVNQGPCAGLLAPAQGLQTRSLLSTGAEQQSSGARRDTARHAGGRRVHDLIPHRRR